MRANVTITDLVKMPNFGANKIIKASLTNLAASQFLEYSFARGEKLARFLTLRPNPLNEDMPIRNYVEVAYDASVPAIVTLFNKLKQGEFIDKGEVLGDKLKEAVVPIREKYLKDKLGYGTNPQVTRVVRGGRNRAILYFTTTKNGKPQTHSANWTLTDLASEVTDVISIPKTLFSTYREFNAILESLLTISPGRLMYKVDPADVKEGSVEVFVNPTDLVYSGSITVMLPDSGDKATKISKLTKSPTTPPPVFNVIVTADANSTVEVPTADQDDVLYVRITATGLTAPTNVTIGLTQADSSNGATLDATTVEVPVTGYATVPLMVETVLNDANMSVTVTHNSVVADTAIVALKAPPIPMPTYAAINGANLVNAGAEIGVQVAPDDPNTRYVPKNVVWTSDHGVTFEMLSPDKLSVLATFPAELAPNTVVNIVATIDGVAVNIYPITIRDPG